MLHYKTIIAASLIFCSAQTVYPAAHPGFLAGSAMLIPDVKTEEPDQLENGKPKTFKVEKGGTLDVSLNIGSITVNTWSRDEVFIEAREFDEDESAGIKASLTGNTVKVEYDETSGDAEDLTLMISVPVEFNVDLRTLSGDLKVTGALKGTLKGSTAGGDLHFENVDGPVEMNTSGGDIHGGNVGSSAVLNSAGGDIRLGTIRGNADIKTMGGDIQMGDVAGKLNVKTYGGDIRLGNTGSNSDISTYGGSIQAENVSGGAKISTMGGDIRIDKGSGIIKAKTMGGDITLGSITGSIEASTASGDIKATLIPQGNGKSSISTMNGSIILSIPESAKAVIRAQLRYHDEESEIRSDFESTTFDKSPEKIQAVYTLNGGGEEISLRAINADIIIHKMLK